MDPSLKEFMSQEELAEAMRLQAELDDATLARELQRQFELEGGDAPPPEEDPCRDDEYLAAQMAEGAAAQRARYLQERSGSKLRVAGAHDEVLRGQYGGGHAQAGFGPYSSEDLDALEAEEDELELRALQEADEGMGRVSLNDNGHIRALPRELKQNPQMVTRNKAPKRQKAIPVGMGISRRQVEL